MIARSMTGLTAAASALRAVPARASMTGKTTTTTTKKTVR